MAGYGEGLKFKDLCKIYEDLKNLPKEVQHSLNKNGYHYTTESSDPDDLSYQYLNYLSKESIKFFLDFVNYMCTKGYILKYKGEEVAADIVFQKILDEDIDVEEGSGDNSYYFEYVAEDNVPKRDLLPDIIYLHCLLIKVFSDEPLTVDYNGSVYCTLYDKLEGTVDMIRSILDDYALDSDFYACLDIDRVICYDPHIIGKYLSIDNSQDTKYNWASLYIDVNPDVIESLSREKVYAVFDEFCPCLDGKYSWSKPKSLPKNSGSFLISVLNNDCVHTAHLYMKNEEPVVDFLFKGNDVWCEGGVNVNLAKWVISNFGNNIKEVFITFCCGRLIENKVIARKNDDGELTLTMY